MTPDAFIRTWDGNPLSERASAQSHFRDLCALLEVEPPSPRTHGWFEFEKGARKAAGTDGWADVWRRDAFAWEYKKRKANLDAAYAQVQGYAPALDFPPLLIVSDTQDIVIRTAFTGAVQERHALSIHDLRDAGHRDLLRRAFDDPGAFRPRRTRADLTEDAAATFADLAHRLRDGCDGQQVAHFVNRLVFCMFAEDVGLLPDKMFEKMVLASDPASFQQNCRDLFRAMANRGGRIGFTPIPWFNGGLFDDDAAIPLGADDIAMLRRAAKMDWSQIDASLLGTLFERGLDPAKRSQLGAHYTDAAKIMAVVEPVVLRPLRAEWAAAKAGIEAALAAAPKATADRLLSSAEKGRATKALDRAERLHRDFLARLRRVRVLDPACGSGNFLNLALTALKDLEHRVNLDAEALGLQRPAPSVGPEAVLGLEISSYAAELARVSIWICEIQWMRRNGFEAARDPILKPLDTIRCVDALLEWEGDGATDARRDPSSSDATRPPGEPSSSGSTRGSTAGVDPRVKPEDDSGKDGADDGGEGAPHDDAPAAAPPPAPVARLRPWPEAEFIVGNPPFLGNKKMVAELGEDYAATLRRVHGHVPGGADLVAYWVAGAWRAISEGRTRRAGLVTTNSIRGGANRAALAGPAEAGAIFEAWSDEDWTVAGAAVRVSMVMFGERGAGEATRLDGAEVERVAADLTSGLDLTVAVRLGENRGVAFQGPVKVGAFDVSGDQAREFLKVRGNANGRPNSDVVRPWVNGSDIVRRPSDTWIIDFADMPETDASFYEGPFELVRAVVKPKRDQNRRERRRIYWWQHGETVPGLRTALREKDRCIVSPRVAKHRLFVWCDPVTLPDTRVVAIARDDDTTFGILHSRFHEAWSLGTGGWHGVGNDPQYTPTKSFETFPFPEGLSPDIPAANYAGDPRAQAIAAAARDLDGKREAWLNPPDLVRRVPEVMAGYPDRLLPVDDAAARELKTRTLTNLYNARPAWLSGLHARLDAAVAAAYGWPEDISEEAALAALLALNADRAAPNAAKP